jgi:hypothetical protein
MSAMEQQEIRIISQRSGCIVRGHDGSYVTKTGGRVRRAEEEAIKLPSVMFRSVCYRQQQGKASRLDLGGCVQ